MNDFKHNQCASNDRIVALANRFTASAMMPKFTHTGQ
ncbi:hypothetical protein VMF7928_03409 [Vibrio marisflavi CECT 7928]|uniref:Uncharacterized protein n=1 Tax=Vibrio marisflavi CECT 7928 TaxID=634439 RepID=A0ABN8E672_9VIBR|nr:hypothetical protein VMF7928_03409 [Vibrio marisflavi CECT 7928]